MTEREYQTRRGDTTPMERPLRRERTIDELMGSTPPSRRSVTTERVSGPTGVLHVRREHVSVPGAAERRAASVRSMQGAISFVVGTILALLAIRFVLFLLGANQANGFVQLMLAVTQPLVAPFQGIFGEPTFGASVVEWAAVVAIAIYGLVGYGLHRLVDIMAPPARVSQADDQ